MAEDLMRLQKWLAEGGIASRRKAEELITAGKVKLNGKIATLGDKGDPAKDRLEVDGKKVTLVTKKVYIALNKPTGVVTTVTDTHDRPTVMDYVPTDTRLYPIGRLDADTSGLLLLTNDGDFAQRLMHPKYEAKKTYVAVVTGVPGTDVVAQLRKGVVIEGKRTAPAQVKVEELIPGKEKTTRVRITIHEGRNRQVRKMWEAVGHKVLQLKRIGIGSLMLGTLPEGKWRKLTPPELKTFEKLGEDRQNKRSRRRR